MLRWFENVQYAVLAGIAALCAAGATPAFAVTAHSMRAAIAPSAAASDIVKVHARQYRHKHHRRHRIVEAPFTRVETNRHYGAKRRVVVDAPFAHVMVGRHGRRIIAPFVDIWIPR